MGISAIQPVIAHAGNDVTLAFAFNFKAYASSQVQVYVVSALGVETLQTLTTHYTVALNTGEGGTVTMVTAPITGETLLIRSNILHNQPDAIDTGPMPNRTIEQMSDRITLLTQQNSEVISRAPQFKKSSTSSTPTVAEPEDGKLLGWNAAGDIANYSTSTLDTGTLVLDEDDMISDSNVAVPTQQSVKAHVIPKALLTAKGDLIITTAASTPARLGIGTNEYALIADSAQSAGMKWANLYKAVVTKTAAYTITTANKLVLADASSSAFSITLPPVASVAGQPFEVMKIDSTFNGVTISDGVTSTILRTENESVICVSDGTVYRFFRTIPSVWTAYTPTGTWTSNATYTGQWRRIGDSAEIQMMVTLTGAPNSATLKIAMPSGLTVDTANIEIGGANYHEFNGAGAILDGGSAVFSAHAVYLNDSTNISIYTGNSSGTYIGRNTVTQAIPVTFANTDTVQVSFVAPITGWNG